jgi:hypothetical protein
VNDNRNQRETGARILVSRPEVEKRNRLDTGDAGDRPKRPYGLTEDENDRGASTRHYDGVNRRSEPTQHD